MKNGARRQSAGKDSRGRKKRRRAPSAAQSLLILHLDADKLRSDGLHLNDVAQFSGALSAVAFGAPVVIEDATSTDDLHQTLATLVTAKETFDVIVVVAHSNAAGIRIASDRFVSWDAFAGYMKPLKPRRLLLVACRGGRWDAGEALFTSMPQLRRIFACPINATKDFGALMLFAVPYVVAERRPKDKHVTFVGPHRTASSTLQSRGWRSM